MINKKELKRRLLVRVENLERYKDLTSYQEGISTGLKDILEMLGYTYNQIYDSDARLFEIRKLEQT